MQKFGGAVMPCEDNTIIEFNQYRKSKRVLSIIYAVFESLIK